VFTVVVAASVVVLSDPEEAAVVVSCPCSVVPSVAGSVEL